MFPIGDSPNPRGFAIVNVALIAVNVLVYVLLMPQMAQPADPQDPRFSEYVQLLSDEGRVQASDQQALESQITEYDLTVFEYGSRPNQWSWMDMFTSMFLHGGFMHLFGNMLFLWIYGNNVEHRLGRIGYLLAYLATGFVAAFGDILLRPESGIPAVGASGAISGVLGMYFLWFPRNRVRMLILMPPIVRQMELSARWVLGFYIVVQNIFPALMSSGGGGGVAHGAHIGGFIGGVALAGLGNLWALSWPGREVQPDEKTRPGEIAEAHQAEGGLHGRFRAALDEGDVHRASRLFFGTQSELAREGFDAADAVRLGDGLGGAGEPAGALAAYDRALALHPDYATAAAAHLGAARTLVDSYKQPTLAYQHVYDALEVGTTESQSREARQLLDEIGKQVSSMPGQFVSP